MTLATLPPPHADPHPPTLLRVPAGACDAHCHIFGPTSRFPYLVGRSYEPAETPLARYREMADRMGFAHAVFVQPAVYGSDHSAILDALEGEPGRYGGVGIVDENLDDAMLARMHAAGFRGARFNFVGHLGGRPSHDIIHAVRDRVAPWGWHLVFHVDAASLGDEADFFDRLDTPFVIDHMARLDAGQGIDQPAFRRLVDLAALPNCWVKISAGDRMAGADGLDQAVPFMAALAAAAPGRTLWGSDWPHPNSCWMPDDGDMIDLLACAVPDEALRCGILVDNPRQLYPLDGSH